MEDSIIRYYKSLSTPKKKKVKALLEARVLMNQDKDREAIELMQSLNITRQDLLEFHKYTWDYMFHILPAESILKNLE
jgi:hypothetical protein